MNLAVGRRLVTVPHCHCIWESLDATDEELIEPQTLGLHRRCSIPVEDLALSLIALEEIGLRYREAWLPDELPTQTVKVRGKAPNRTVTEVVRIEVVANVQTVSGMNGFYLEVISAARSQFGSLVDSQPEDLVWRVAHL